MQGEVGAWRYIGTKTYVRCRPFPKSTREGGKTVRSGIKKRRCEYHLRKESESLSSLECVWGPTASSCYMSRCWCVPKASVNIAIVPHPPPAPHVSLWDTGNDTWTDTSPHRRNARKKKKKPRKHHIPLTILRRSVRLMDTQASLKAKRTPDIWEGSPTLKWITLKQNILSQIGFVLKFSTALGGGGRGCLPPLGLLRTWTATNTRMT